MAPGTVIFEDGPSKTDEGAGSVTSNAGFKAFRSLTTLTAHLLIGIIVGASLLFAFRNGVPMNVTNQHVILCVLGYQFLMAEAILALAPDSWLSTLSVKHKRWVHWILQVGGSALALGGCFLMCDFKATEVGYNFDTLHGRFALASMIFTFISLVNGLTSIYAYELRKVKIHSGLLSKLTHICFGIAAFGTASISLAYGFDKNFFRAWATSRFTDTLIIMTGSFTVIIIINPFIVFYKKLAGAFSR